MVRRRLWTGLENAMAAAMPATAAWNWSSVRPKGFAEAVFLDLLVRSTMGACWGGPIISFWIIWFGPGMSSSIGVEKSAI